MLEENYFSKDYSYLLGEDLSSSLYNILRSHGTIPMHAIKTVAICFPTKKEQEELEIPEGQPLLLHHDTASGSQCDSLYKTARQSGTLHSDHYQLITSPEH